MSAPEINVERLMQRIKENPISAVRSGTTLTFISAEGDLDLVAASLKRIRPAVRPATPVRLSLSELEPISPPTSSSAVRTYRVHWRHIARHDGGAFIKAAYQAILGREVDVDGLACYGAMLRDGASKVEILGRICDSSEAQERHTRVIGLALPYAIDKVSRWPVLGGLVSLVRAIWNLPQAERHYRRLACDLSDRLDRQKQCWARMHAEVYAALRVLERSQNSLGEIGRFIPNRHQADAIQHALLAVIAAIRTLQLATNENARCTVPVSPSTTFDGEVSVGP